MEPREYWFILSLNPEPWATGPLGYNSKTRSPYMGRNQQLDAYKQAVKENLLYCYPDTKPLEGELEILFLFWRQRATYATLGSKGRTVTKNKVDTTNMQKATEDALQGILFPNDKEVRRITSELVDQGPDVEGKVAIRLSQYEGFQSQDIPEDVYAQLTSQPTLDAAPDVYGEQF